jgi:hypothetical protein
MGQEATKSNPAPTRASAAGMARSGLPVWLMAMVLLAGTILAYRPVWHAGFIWDDERHVTEN